MADAAAIAQGLYQAALVSQNPQSTQAQRAEAIQFIEQVKAQDVHAVLQAAMQIAAPQQPLELQVVGLSLLQQQAQGRWKQMNADAQRTLSEIANQFFAQVARGESAWVLKGKAAQLLASVSVQQGAEAFRALVTQLLGVGPKGEAIQVEMVCLVLQYVSEDVTHFEDMNGAARKPLLAAVMASAVDALTFVTQALEHHMTAAVGWKAAGNPANAAAHLAAVGAAFGMSRAYADWAPLKSMAASQLVSALMRFMEAEEFRMAALDVLKQITGRKAGNEAEDVYVPFMSHLGGVLVTIAEAILKPEFLSHLDWGGGLEEFGLRLCSTLTTFHEMHFRCLGEQADKLRCMRQMLKFLEHPYLRLAAQALPFWMHHLQKLAPLHHSSAASAGTAAAGGAAAGAAAAAGGAGTGASEGGGGKKTGTARGTVPPKPAYLQAYDPPDDVWHALALALTGHVMRVVLVPDIEVEPPDYFETPQEHREFCSGFRGQLKVVLRGTAGRAPHRVLQCTTQFLQFCLERSGPAGQGGKEQQLAHLEAAVFCLEAVIAPMMDHPDRDVLLPGVSQLLQTLMQYRNPCPANILLQMRGLEAFGKALELMPHMVLPLLETGLNLMQSIPLSQSGQLPPPSEVSAAHKEASNARLLCAKLLLSLARDAPRVLAPHLQSMAGRMEALWQEGKLQEGERVQLCEGLLCAASALDPASQQMVLDWMLKPLHAVWTTQQWQQHLTSANEFAATFLPYHQEADGKVLIDARDKRWALYHQLALVERCVRRSAEAPPVEDGQTSPAPHPWNTHLEWVLVPVLMLIAAIHALWTPGMQAQLRPVKGILDIDPRERAVRLKADMQEAKKEFETVSVAGASETSVRLWLQGIREMCYMVLYGASAHCQAFWFNQRAAALMPQTLLAHLEYMEHRHLRTLLRHVVVFWVGRCPPSLRDQWLGPLLAPLVPHMLPRLTEAWGQLACTTTAPSGSEQQLSQERLEDSLVRDVAKEYMEVLVRTVSHAGEELKPDASHSQAGVERNNVLDYLLGRDQQLAVVAVATANSALSWPDTDIARRALLFLRLVIPKLGLRIGGLDVLAASSLQAVLAALSAPPFLSVQSDLLTFAAVLLQLYLQHVPSMRQQLQALPKVNPQMLADFEAAFFNSRAEKVQRDLVKALLVEAGSDEMRALLLVNSQVSSLKAVSAAAGAGDAMFS